MYQKLVLVGRIGNALDQRYTPDLKAVTTFDIAIDTGTDKPIWVRIVTWEKLAESCSQYLGKGSMVLVEGVLQPDKSTGNPKVFQRKDGTWGSVYEVRANQVKFLSPKSEAGNANEKEDYTDLF